MAGIWVFADTRDQTLELLNAGLNLAKDLGGKLVTFALSNELAQEYISHGADEVLLFQPPAQDQPLEACVPVLVQAAREEAPEVFLVGATKRGQEIGARVAAQLNTGLCSNCTGFGLDKEKGLLQMERLLFGGLAVQKLVCATRPQMATFSPRSFEPAPLIEGREGKIRELPAVPASPVKVISRTAKAREAVDITEAKIVVCIGRGFAKKEDIQVGRDLADALGGEVGCSRPIAEELHWLPEDVYLGISGKKIKPDLYVGIGISGQIQHVTGIRDSKIIFAINRDENAPIFEAADYGIVGDLYKVVPLLTEELKKALKR
jgi:electron transfer flavoprotein alpha subunit